MVRILSGNWWLLALCGVFDVLISVIYFGHAGRGFHWPSSVRLLGELTIACGVCMIAAGVWNSRNRSSWLLALCGLACSALGLIFTFWRGPLGFRTIALLVVVMAASIGSYELSAGQLLRRHHVTDEWFSMAAGVISVGFAVAFLAFIFGWIRLEPQSPGQTLRWLGSFFGFCAICMFGLPWVQRTFPATRAGVHAH
ncbi:MAG TPA: hypothetical protein VH351_13380 [Bryobacteraceae bacterium]|nr:hypothetical protein [Bryobacteraceae bacterium]